MSELTLHLSNTAKPHPPSSEGDAKGSLTAEQRARMKMNIKRARELREKKRKREQMEAKIPCNPPNHPYPPSAQIIPPRAALKPLPQALPSDLQVPAPANSPNLPTKDMYGDGGVDWDAFDLDSVVAASSSAPVPTPSHPPLVKKTMLPPSLNLSQPSIKPRAPAPAPAVAQAPPAPPPPLSQRQRSPTTRTG